MHLKLLEWLADTRAFREVLDVILLEKFGGSLSLNCLWRKFVFYGPLNILFVVDMPPFDDTCWMPLTSCFTSPLIAC